jgi:hypothetical protein
MFSVADLPINFSNLYAQRAVVKDALNTTGIVQGGGANVIPVFYDGTNWVSDFGSPASPNRSVQINNNGAIGSAEWFTVDAFSNVTLFNRPFFCNDIRFGADPSAPTIRVNTTQQVLPQTYGLYISGQTAGPRGIGIARFSPTVSNSVVLQSMSLGFAGGYGGPTDPTLADSVSAFDGTGVSGMIEINQGNVDTGLGTGPGTPGILRLNMFLVSELPILTTPHTIYRGARTTVSDAATTNFGDIVVGGGTFIMPVWSDGFDWRIG